MDDNEELDPPSPQDLSNLFAAEDLLYRSSSDSAEYKRECLKANVICSYTLSAVECPDSCSRALSIELNRK